MRWLSAWLLAGQIAAGLTAALAGEPEPDGYRGEPYRGAVPDTLTGATVVGEEGAAALLASGRVAFVDVLPAPVRPENLPKDTIWRDPPHETIPGALWLPNTGYAALDDETRDYFLAGIAAATGGETDAPVVFFCRSECWMSWNAAKRALEHGYTRVFWFPAGTDGWTAAGSDLQAVKPFLP